MANVTGTTGNDSLIGTTGNDYLDGGAGADTMSGLAGDDVYVVDNANDTVVEGSGEGTDRINALVSYTLPPNVENLWLVGVADTSGVGNELDNTLWGNGGANTLTGLAGNDYIDGGSGADTMVGGSGDDTYWVDNVGDLVVESANEGTDTVNSSLPNYTLPSNVENLTLVPGAGSINATGNELNNVLTGNEGDNVLVGGAGNDTLNGGAGADTMVGGTGDDTFYVDNSGDVVTENPGEGTDTIVSTLATYTLPANVEDLRLGANYYTSANLNGTGNELDNTIWGNQGDNVLNGSGGDDTLIGGDGNDTLTGGAGNDIFYINTTDAGTDTITDLAVGDIIRVCGATFTGSSSDLQVTQSGGNTTLHVGAGANIDIVLNGTYAAENFHTSGFDLWYDPNHAPVLNQPAPDQKTFAGQSYSFNLPAGMFTDADGDNLTYSAMLFDSDWMAIAWPSWLHFNSSTGAISGTPALGDIGAYTVYISAADTHAATADTAFTLTVAEAPTAATQPPSTTVAAASMPFAGTPDNDTIAYVPTLKSIDGGTGLDTVTFSSSHAGFSLLPVNSGFTLKNGSGATVSLTNIERLQFSDTKLALDLTPQGHAGQALELLGILAPSQIHAPSTVGMLLSALDRGTSLHDLCQVIIDAGVAAAICGDSSSAALATTLFRNVVGKTPDAPTLDILMSYMDGRNASLSQADFMATIAGLAANQDHINLIGLQQTGIEYA